MDHEPRVFSPKPRATITLPPAPARGPVVTPVDWSAGDRLTAQAFWASTGKDETAWDCSETLVLRVLNFGMGARPVVHGTPFGHGSLMVHVDRCPLPIAGQLIRHRVHTLSGDGSLLADLDWQPNVSQKSYRYTRAAERTDTELSDVFGLPLASELRHQVGRPGAYVYEPLDAEVATRMAAAMWEQAEDAWITYEKLVEEGVAPEQARLILPQAALTRLYLTASFRNWFTWLVQRNDVHAQEEIQQIARQVEAIIKQVIPLTFDLWESHGRRPL